MRKFLIRFLHALEICSMLLLLVLLYCQILNFVPAYRIASWSFQYSDDAIDPSLVVREIEPHLFWDPYYAKYYYNLASREIGKAYVMGKYFRDSCDIPEPKNVSLDKDYLFKHTNKEDAKYWLKCKNYLCEDGENEYFVAKELANKGLSEESLYWLNISKSYGYQKAIETSADNRWRY